MTAVGRKQQAVGDETTLVRRLARLARVALTPEEEERYAREFQEIVAYVEQVGEVSATAEPLTATITGVAHVVREDAIVPSTLADALVSTAPESERRMVNVPPIL